MHLRKVMIGIAAIGLPVALMSTIVGVGAASAGTTGTGSVTCSALSGSVTFKPPLKGTTANTLTEVQTYKLTVTKCKTTGSNIHTVTKGTTTEVKHTTDTSCHGLIAGSTTAYTFPVVWTSSPAANSSTVGFSGDSPAVVGGKAAFKLPNTGGTSAVSGSFPGSNAGATSHGEGITAQTPGALLAPCSTSGGLKTIKIVKGNLTLS